MDSRKDNHIAKAVTSELSEKEERELRKWLGESKEDKDHFELNKKIWQDSSQLEIARGMTEIGRWEQLNQSTTPTKPTLYAYWISGIAATLLLIGVMFYQFMESPILTVYHAENGVKNISLPDGSNITLREGSSIQMNSSSFQEFRELSLDGEAYFEVERSLTPFVISTNLGQVTVLGTTFNIVENEDRMEVVCITGKVEVRDHQNELSQVLKKGTISSMTKDSAFSAPEKVRNPDLYKSWIEGLLYYRKEKLKSIFIDLERIYGVQIKASHEFSQQKFTGLLPETSLKDALEILSVSSGSEFNLIDNQVIVE